MIFICMYVYINISPHIGFTEALKKLVAFSPSSPPASFVWSSRDRFGSDEWDPVRISTWIAIFLILVNSESSITNIIQPLFIMIIINIDNSM